MNMLFRLAVAAALVAGFGGLAHAQSHRPLTAPDHYYAMTEGRSAVVDRTVEESGTVPPSESRTVMGLRVPR